MGTLFCYLLCTQMLRYSLYEMVMLQYGTHIRDLLRVVKYLFLVIKKTTNTYYFWG